MCSRSSPVSAWERLFFKKWHEWNKQIVHYDVYVPTRYQRVKSNFWTIVMTNYVKLSIQMSKKKKKFFSDKIKQCFQMHYETSLLRND